MEIKKILIGLIIPIVIGGLAYAADQRIDQRVQFAIDDFQKQEIRRKIEFYIMKEEFAPNEITSDDRINKKILERQLKRLNDGH